MEENKIINLENLTKYDEKIKEKIQEVKQSIPSLTGYATEKYVSDAVSASEATTATNLDKTLKSAKDYTDNAIIKDIKEVKYDEKTGVFTFVAHDSTEKVVDLPIEQLLKEGRYDDKAQELVLVMESGDEIRIPATGLIDDYSAEDTDTIQLSVSAQNVFKAILKGQSVKKTHLDLALQGEIDNKLEQSDLTNYVKNTDYATNEKGGVIKTSSTYGADIDSSGYLWNKVRTYDEYEKGSSNLFIGKGTLENVIPKKLENYVQFTNYASDTKAGVIKTSDKYGFLVDGNGLAFGRSKDYDEYQDCSTNMFITKGTLDNVVEATIGEIDTILDYINGDSAAAATSDNMLTPSEDSLIMEVPEIEPDREPAIDNLMPNEDIIINIERQEDIESNNIDTLMPNGDINIGGVE